MNCGSLFHDRFLYFEWFTYSGMNFYPSLIHFRAVESFRTSDSLFVIWVYSYLKLLSFHEFLINQDSSLWFIWLLTLPNSFLIYGFLSMFDSLSKWGFLVRYDSLLLLIFYDWLIPAIYKTIRYADFHCVYFNNSTLRSNIIHIVFDSLFI